MIIALLFVGSGCSALIYEIVRFQLLELVIGSSRISLGVLLGTFMGGMCLGSLLLPRFVSAQHHPLRVYALLEAGIGIIGVAVLVLTVPPVNGALIAYGRFLSFRLGLRDAQTKAPFVPNILYAGEGMNASIAVSGPSAGVRNFHVSGKIEAISKDRDTTL